MHRVIFSLRESDITLFGRSVILFTKKTAEGNNTCRKTNITAKQYNSPQGE